MKCDIAEEAFYIRDLVSLYGDTEAAAPPEVEVLDPSPATAKACDGVDGTSDSSCDTHDSGSTPGPRPAGAAQSTRSSVLILVEGADFLQLYNYLANYVSHARQSSNLDVAISGGSTYLLTDESDAGADSVEQSKGDPNAISASVEVVGPNYARKLAHTFQQLFGALTVGDANESVGDASESVNESVSGATPFSSVRSLHHANADAVDQKKKMFHPAYLRSPSFFRDMPQHSCLPLVCARGADRYLLVLLKASLTGERGVVVFGHDSIVREFTECAMYQLSDEKAHASSHIVSDISAEVSTVRNSSSDAFSASNSVATVLGAFQSYDILRLEAGHPRVGQDIKPGLWSPIRCSLSWILDQSKLRSHTLFGHERLFRQLARGPTYRRVGILLETAGVAAPGQCILSRSGMHGRRVIGVITSVLWSPCLGRRIAMGYVKPEYAQKGLGIQINMLYDLPTHKIRNYARIRYHLKQGNRRADFRKLVNAEIVEMPFIKHQEEDS